MILVCTTGATDCNQNTEIAPLGAHWSLCNIDLVSNVSCDMIRLDAQAVKVIKLLDKTTSAPPPL